MGRARLRKKDRVRVSKNCNQAIYMYGKAKDKTFTKPIHPPIHPEIERKYNLKSKTT